MAQLSEWSTIFKVPLFPFVNGITTQQQLPFLPDIRRGAYY